MAKRKARPARRKRQAPKSSRRQKRSSIIAAQRRLQRALATLDKAKLALKNAERHAKGLKRVAARKPKLAKTQKHETRSLKGALDFLGSLVGESKRKVRGTNKTTRKTKAPRSEKPKKHISREATPSKKIEPRISVRKLKSGQIKTIAFDVPYVNLDQWLEALQDNPTLDGLIPENATLGFRFYGNNSLQTFKSVKDAALRIATYEATLHAIYDKPEDQLDVYKHVEFTLVETDAIPEWHRVREERLERFNIFQGQRKRKTSKYKKLSWHLMKERNPGLYAQRLAKKRERARARYNRLKNDPLFRAKKAMADRKFYRSLK